MAVTANLHRPQTIDIEDNSCTASYACISFQDANRNTFNIWFDEAEYHKLREAMALFAGEKAARPEVEATDDVSY